jgi:hypothetical protein
MNNDNVIKQLKKHYAKETNSTAISNLDLLKLIESESEFNVKLPIAIEHVQAPKTEYKIDAKIVKVGSLLIGYNTSNTRIQEDVLSPIDQLASISILKQSV